MSVQKLKVFKKLKGGQTYSQNPIIDSLIRQKLRSQMAVVKDNFQQIVKRQQSHQRDTESIQRNIRKKRLSQNIQGLNADKIKQSLSFTPVSKEVLAFLNQRQTSSPFFAQEQLDIVNKARTNDKDFILRLNGKSKVDYQMLGSSDKLDSMTNQVRKNLSDDLWLPNSPNVNQIVSFRDQDMLEQSKLPPFNFTISLKSQTLSPLKSYRASSAQSLSREITYLTKKFHKNDYISLDIWLTASIQHLNKLSHPQNINKQVSLQNISKSASLQNINKLSSIQEQSTNPVDPMQHLNSIYGVYMCAFKELIRLTYIQSSEKGLLIEKMVWSLVRLFQELLAQQHRILSKDFRQFSQQRKELHQLYTNRMEKLQTLLQQTEQKLKTTQQGKRSIGLSCLSYKRVNQDMVGIIHDYQRKFKQFELEKNLIAQKLQKLLLQFQRRKIVHIEKTQTHLIYFYLNKDNKPETVAKVPKQAYLYSHFQTESRMAAQLQIQEHPQLQNDLNVYWSKKKDYLEIDRIIDEQIKQANEEKGVQIDGRGPYEMIDLGTQYPQGDEETFQQLLSRQLNQERENWSKKQSQMHDVTVSLKELYDQARDTITMLTTKNTQMQQKFQQKEHELEYFTRKLQQVEQRAGLLGRKIEMMQAQIEQSNKLCEEKAQEIIKLNYKITQEKKRFMFEKENNNILVTNKLQLQQKILQVNNKFNDLEERIKILAPQFQQMIKQQFSHPIIVKLGRLLLQHLSEYVEKDAQVFLTH